MKTLKLILIWFVITVTMIISWIIGNLVGNAMTSTTPPPPADTAQAGLMFLAVCAFNSVLITILLRATDGYSGLRRSIALVMYVFVIQCLLPQMETYFFASDIGISYAQVTAILIAGIIVCFTTLPIALLIYKNLKLASPNPEPVTISFNKWSLLLLTVVVYPFLYLTFGYYIAWQNEDLRIFYTSSPAIASYLEQFATAFVNGIYFFQILRGLIWVIVTTPIAMMLSKNKVTQFLLIGILSSLLPSSLLFIPNPYMPWDIAMTHFVETASSNFIWGLAMVWGVRRDTNSRNSRMSADS